MIAHLGGEQVGELVARRAEGDESALVPLFWIVVACGYLANLISP